MYDVKIKLAKGRQEIFIFHTKILNYHSTNHFIKPTKINNEKKIIKYLICSMRVYFLGYYKYYIRIVQKNLTLNLLIFRN